VDVWRISETTFDARANLLGETLFCVGNGYIGLRGAHEEGSSAPSGLTLDGAYLNGFYESEPIHYAETAYGLAKHNQFMVNVPNGKRIDLFLEDERFDLLQGTILAYERSLDFRTGVLTRSVDWLSPGGRRVAVQSRRLACFVHKHLYAMQYAVTPLNFSGTIALVSILDGDVQNLEARDDPRAGSTVSGPVLQLLDAERTGDYVALIHRTRNSGFTLVSAVASRLDTGDLPESADSGGAGVSPALVTDAASSGASQCVEQRYRVQALEGHTICLTKYGTYFTSRDYPAAELLERSRETLRQAQAEGFSSLCAQQQRFLSDFWQQADVEITGDDALQQGIRFNQFHLLQSVGRDGKTNIAAKGVTGEGYEGHYFWDSEIYVIPFFLFTKPDIARKLLEYRYQGLDQARARAREMSHVKGALYPWRTIGGEECSAYFPAGTAQYHFNADIAYSIKLYTEVTGDESFLIPYGAEIVMETARIWMGIGGYVERRQGQFCINEVTGPDEYTALVNNNYYTNAMAKMHLHYAAVLAETMAAAQPEAFANLAARMALQPEEPALWRRAADRMYLPYDESLGVHPQDDSFLTKQTWDFAGTPKDHYPLLLHYHPLVIYRYQVCKQADVVLALLLLGNWFSLEEKRRDFDYYERVTTHDSSLSSCIFSIIASEIGYHDTAYDYFMHTARMDLDNVQGNTEYGVHTAAMAGTWLAVVYGFAGMRVFDGSLGFAPHLPKHWSGYQFKIRFKRRLLRVRVSDTAAEYSLLEGDAIALQHETQVVTLTPDAPVQAASLD